jgi:hypothetical protein
VTEYAEPHRPYKNVESYGDYDSVLPEHRPNKKILSFVDKSAGRFSSLSVEVSGTSVATPISHCSHVTPWITSWINFSYASSAGGQTQTSGYPDGYMLLKPKIAWGLKHSDLICRYAKGEPVRNISSISLYMCGLVQTWTYDYVATHKSWIKYD